MEEVKVNNYAMLRGTLAQAPCFSHENRGERFYQFPLEVLRLSGAADTINVIVRQELAESVELENTQKLCVSGELRSFNNKSGEGPKLIISVFARELWFDDGEDENIIELTGTVCKQPNLRVTPMGREICDLMIAVNRRYGRLSAVHSLGRAGAQRSGLGCRQCGGARRQDTKPQVHKEH